MDWTQFEKHSEGASASLDEIRLPTEGSKLQDLLDAYCEHYKVALPDRRLRWAIRDPLSVRLYCDLNQGGTRWGSQRQELSLPGLLRAKLDAAEDAMRDKGGFGRHLRPLHTALKVIASRYV